MQTEKKRDRIAVLIPCYNEALTIGKVVRDYRQALPDADIYVYDNNSTDETARLAREAGAIVRPEPRQGKGNVVRTMFRDIEADCYLMVDGDDTYPASQAAALCAPVLEGRADMVIGDRLSSTYFTENKRPFHNSGNMLVRRCINMFWKRGRHVEDVMTGMRAMSPLFVKSFPILSQGFEIETGMTIFSLANSFRITSMPIQDRDRPEGSFSKLSAPVESMQLGFSLRPGIGGWALTEPVATMIASAVISSLVPSVFFTESLPGAVNLASPSIFVTLFILNRPAMPLVSFLDISFLCAMTCWKLTFTLSTSIPISLP